MSEINWSKKSWVRFLLLTLFLTTIIIVGTTAVVIFLLNKCFFSSHFNVIGCTRSKQFYSRRSLWVHLRKSNKYQQTKGRNQLLRSIERSHRSTKQFQCQPTAMAKRWKQRIRNGDWFYQLDCRWANYFTANQIWLHKHWTLPTLRLRVLFACQPWG